MPKLKPGDKAPDFTLTDQRGRAVKLKDFRGKKVVVYFYPKADTPGCTTQSCSLRDAEPDLKKLRPFYEELIAEYFPATVRW